MYKIQIIDENNNQIHLFEGLPKEIKFYIEDHPDILKPSSGTEFVKWALVKGETEWIINEPIEDVNNIKKFDLIIYDETNENINAAEDPAIILKMYLSEYQGTLSALEAANQKRKILRIFASKFIPEWIKDDAPGFKKFVDYYLTFLEKHYYTQYQNFLNAMDLDIIDDINEKEKEVKLLDEGFSELPIAGDKIIQGEVEAEVDLVITEKNFYIIMDKIADSFDLTEPVKLFRDDTEIAEADFSEVNDITKEFYVNLFLQQYGYNLRNLLSADKLTLSSKATFTKNIKTINVNKGNRKSFQTFFNTYRTTDFIDQNVFIRIIDEIFEDKNTGELIAFENPQEGDANPDLKPVPFLYQIETNLDPLGFREVLENSIHPIGFRMIYDFIEGLVRINQMELPGGFMIDQTIYFDNSRNQDFVFNNDTKVFDVGVGDWETLKNQNPYPSSNRYYK